MSRFTSFLYTVGCVMFAGVLGAGNVLATTPDGSTPANEGVCDPLKVDGVTKGLYGLCVAYCEAQDLDSIDKAPPSVKILENYNRKKQAGDPDMPCVFTPCPCWNSDELASVNDLGTASCNRLGSSIQIIDNAPLHLADANTESMSLRCRYIDTGLDPAVVRVQFPSQEEANSCFSQIDQYCASLGQ